VYIFASIFVILATTRKKKFQISENLIKEREKENNILICPNLIKLETKQEQK